MGILIYIAGLLTTPIIFGLGLWIDDRNEDEKVERVIEELSYDDLLIKCKENIERLGGDEFDYRVSRVKDHINGIDTLYLIIISKQTEIEYKNFSLPIMETETYFPLDYNDKNITLMNDVISELKSFKKLNYIRSNDNS